MPIRFMLKEAGTNVLSFCFWLVEYLEWKVIWQLGSEPGLFQDRRILTEQEGK